MKFYKLKNKKKSSENYLFFNVACAADNLAIGTL